MTSEKDRNEQTAAVADQVSINFGLEIKAGDAVLFTEHLRHGGLTNHSDQVRKTLHVGCDPYWMKSQNISTMDEPQHITSETLE